MMRSSKALKRLSLFISLSIFTQSSNAAITLSSIDATRLDDHAGAGTGNLDPDGLGDSDRGFANMLVGFFGNNAGVEDMMSVWVFQMTGTSNGVDISDADFSVEQTNNSAGGLVADAHIIRTSNAATINISDFQTSAQVLMSDFGAGGNGTQDLDVAGQNILTSYLQTNWVENNYIFIGIKNQNLPSGLEVASGDTNDFRFYTAGANGGMLSLTIPEPSSIILVALSSLFLLRRIRK